MQIGNYQLVSPSSVAKDLHKTVEAYSAEVTMPRSLLQFSASTFATFGLAIVLK